jgi:ABC-type sugar transport system ATPase subunit
MAILMVSSELPEVLGLSDRTLVMHQGRMVAQLETDKTSEEEIMRYATGQVQ